MRNKLLASVVGVGALFAVSSANAFLIDNFDSGVCGPAVASFGGTTTLSCGGIAGTDTVGGTRDYSATNTGGFTNTEMSFINLASGGANAGTASVSNGGSTTGVGMILWDGSAGASASTPSGAAGANLGGVDLTDGGLQTQFAITVKQALTSPVEFDITLWDTTGAMETAGTGSIAFVTPPGLVDIDVFIGFGLYTTVDLTSIDAVKLTILASVPDQDIRIDLLETTHEVPEPVSIALLGAGLLGIGAMRRRRALAA